MTTIPGEIVIQAFFSDSPLATLVIYRLPNFSGNAKIQRCSFAYTNRKRRIFKRAGLTDELPVVNSYMPMLE